MIRWWKKTLIGKLKAAWQRFADIIFANKKTSIISTILGLFFIVGLTFFALTMNTKIRASQISSLIYESLPTQKVMPLSYNQGDEAIIETKAISVMFAKPNRSDTNQVWEIIDQKNDELNRNFYYYPIVYRSNETAQRYNLDPNEVTLIFFKTEKRRIVLH